MAKYFIELFCSFIILTAALYGADGPGQPTISHDPFGTAPDGTPVNIYTITNKNGMEARITNYGGILVSLRVPDKTGAFGDVVLGYDSLPDYIGSSPYFGAIIGRYGNRIAKGKFTLDSKECALAINNGKNHLHGGIKGFDKVVWHAEENKRLGEQSVILTYLSKDGEEGYPGNLDAKVIYTVTDRNELKIRYFATTDMPTVVNLTHHSYFNLAGAGNGDILKHELMIDADTFTPVDSGLIPTGELRSVHGTPMDFTKPAEIGSRINAKDEQLHRGGGYDHNFVLNKPKGAAMPFAARVTEKTTGRVMEVYTTEPGIQFYTGNFLDGKNTGKDGKAYKHRSGFCLETQHFPDSPNQPKFPSTILRPGMTYTSTTVYKFSVK